MITKTEQINDVVRGADQEQSFTIDTESSVIFNILRDKMYKNKIGAIAREVASNSRDANREAKSDKPVEVQIISPNERLSMGHLSISFKDYGAGIPPNKMSDIYLKYGASDKRTTNELTGGFGLGAKTPFAYNDTFTVITVADFEGTRKKYTYTAMLDSSGKGKMVTFDTKETDEETGTQIIVPIKTKEDRYKFEREVLKYTKFWDDITYHNFLFVPEKLEEAYKDEQVIIYKTDEYQHENMQMLIDGIPYPLDNDIVGITDTIGRSNSNYITILKFETGELSISANRESVQYDDDTVKAIQDRHAEIVEKLDKITVNHVEDQETYLKACVIAYYLGKASSKMVNPPALTGAVIAHAKSTGKKFKDVTWRGVKTRTSFIFKHHTAFYVKLVNGRNNYEPVKEFQFNEINANSVVYYADTRKNSARNENIWNDGHKDFYLIKPDDANDKRGIEEYMDFIFTFDIDFGVYSDLEVIKSATSRGTYKKKSFVKLNVRTASNRKTTIELDRKEYLTTGGDDLSKVVYLPVNKLSEASWAFGREKLRWLNNNTDYKTFIVRRQDVDNWFSKTKMEHYSDVYDREYAAWEAKIIEEKTALVKNNMIAKVVNDFIDEAYVDLVEDLLPKSVQGVRKGEYVDSDVRDLVKENIKFDFDGLKRKIKPIFVRQYPLIRSIIRDYSISSVEEKREQIELYMNQVNFYNNGK